MLKVIYTSGPWKGNSVLTVPSRESGREYIDRQPRGIKEDLGILETRNGDKQEKAR